ncbi:MAG: radical SAM protein [Candidatus Omnitrophota bacterium]
MSKVLLFKNLYAYASKNTNLSYTLATFNLMSALKNSGQKVVISSYKFSVSIEERAQQEKDLQDLLSNNPDINIIGITLSEDYFFSAKKLISFLVSHCKAFIGVGGVMPSLTPYHVLRHLPQINFLARGDSEKVFSEFAKILEGENRLNRLKDETKNRLSKLSGFYFKHRSFIAKQSLDKINGFEKNLGFVFDYNQLAPKELLDGVYAFTSRGCLNKCLFCSTPGNGKFISRDTRYIFKNFNNYLKRVNNVFPKGFQEHLKVSFYDDDFLTDPLRAKEIFSYFKNSPLKINFFQTGIRSFFSKNLKSKKRGLSLQLIRFLNPEIFFKKDSNIYIGTENFSNNELKSLGKNYSYFMIQKVLKALSEKKIYQKHHLILSNQLTQLEDIFLNLFRIASLQIKWGEYFKILTPIIPYLVSFFPTKSYEIIKSSNRLKYLNVKEVLSNKDAPEFNYPLVKHDLPIDPYVRILVPEIEALFNQTHNYFKIFDMMLYKLLILHLSTSQKDESIERVIKDYRLRYKSLLKKVGEDFSQPRGNIQLMVTRRCHLRCAYCPIEKANLDMKEAVLIKAVDLLFTSSRKDLRIDFTGGEPLLRFDLVKKAVNYAKENAKKKKKSAVSFYMVTNLLALNEEMADFLAENNFFLELSIDGDETAHNLFKISPDKSINPYKQTISKLNILFKRNIDCHAVMVVSPQTTHLLKDNFSHLIQLGFKKIGINYSLCRFWSKKQMELFLKQLELIKEEYFDLIADSRISLTNLGSRDEPAILNSEIMIDVSGEINLLTDWLFEKEAKRKIAPLGHIYSYRDYNKIMFSDFSILDRLVKNYPGDEIRKIILNNIYFGNLTGNFFKTWKEN